MNESNELIYHLPPSLAIRVVEALRLSAMYLAPPEDWKSYKFDSPERYAAQTLVPLYVDLLDLTVSQAHGVELPQRNETASEVYEAHRGRFALAPPWHELDPVQWDIWESVVKTLQDEHSRELVHTMEESGGLMQQNWKLREQIAKLTDALEAARERS